jgi:SPP1 family predicted phage head-tail adaptor
MDIGALRHRITLQTPTSVSDGDSGFIDRWPPDGGTTLATVWASIVPATARDLERVVAGTVQSSATHLVTIRYLAGVTTKTRVVFGSRLLSVTGMQNPEERNISLVLVCQESVT